MKHSIIFLIAFCLLSFSLNGQTVSPKRGVGYNLSNSRDARELATGISWFYNWGVQPSGLISGSYESYGLDYAPMTWGGNFDETTLRNFLTTHPNVKYLLGFNEPNFLSQSNLTPSQVADLWPTLEQIAEDFDLELVGPALNYSGDAVSENGITYYDPVDFYDDFFALYPEAKVDYIGIHYYMSNESQLDEHIQRLYKYGKKIWLTEFNMDNGTDETADQQRDYAVKAVHYLENNSNIFRYAWFLGRADGYPSISLLDETYGQLTALGYVYTKMSSYDASYFHQVNTDIPAEQYLNMSGISVCNLSTDVSDVYVGYIDGEDWIDYNIDVPQGGEYEIEIKAAATQVASFRVTAEDGATTLIEVPNTGGWETWTSVSNTITLQAGQSTLRLKARTGGVNLDNIVIKTTVNTAISPIDSTEEKPYKLCQSHHKIALDSDDLLQVEVYDLGGNLVDYQEGSSVMCQLKSSGLFLLKVRCNGETFVEKVVSRL
ncbi:glycosyl hydrolase [Plebeiibacterium marinum]|uniref:Glycosyl hydrolase n=1 Tax=Plebeiibacterium marinum TaxID=2992111 RepID=A0AAE3MAV3_9BACT|nr:glycosyl hydrolase [Plebeiobacterium marinum]MCW3804498.1 glycosyl hydrolase [Plebeiobacterium marinum]